MKIVTPGTLVRISRQTIFDTLEPDSQDVETQFIQKGTDVLVVGVWSKTVVNVSSAHWIEVLWDGRTGFVHSSDIEPIDAIPE